MLPRKLYQILAGSVQARLNCLEHEERTNEKHDWTDKHTDTIKTLVKNFMPSGSGIDCGTKIDLDQSTGEKLVFHFSYHHMNENGMYDGWTEHKLTVTPSLQFKINLSISGRNRNEIKDYLHETYSCALDEVLEWDDEQKKYYSPEMRKAAEDFQRKVKSGEIV